MENFGTIYLIKVTQNNNTTVEYLALKSLSPIQRIKPIKATNNFSYLMEVLTNNFNKKIEVVQPNSDLEKIILDKREIVINKGEIIEISQTELKGYQNMIKKPLKI